MGYSSTDYESTDKENDEIDINNARKCIRKGDTIYYSKRENINMVGTTEKVHVASTTASSFDSGTKVDKVLSGESLYKVSLSSVKLNFKVSSTHFLPSGYVY